MRLLITHLIWLLILLKKADDLDSTLEPLLDSASTPA